MQRPCRLLTILAAISCSLAATPPAISADIFSEGVRTTDPLSPEAQQKTFKLPPGFKIQLFAAEPRIAKPMNMAFDARGRLWVTSSLEYPFAVPKGRKESPRDTLNILEDTTGDGRADKVSTFGEHLNIPIGLHPFNGGRSALVWSIPNIWRLDDDDGDGVADRREILIGPIGEAVDTHGMQNAFTRGFDGRIYVCHGFRNTSTIRGRDGSEIKLRSGNTYRFAIEGGKVEQFTFGQVNPFGLCFDSLGNVYTADCHSSPIYQLLRGAYYPSFGQPHDGLGFGPLLMQHNHGSTALCGVYHYDGDSNWPEAYRGSLLVGNVMSSRIHRDKLSYTGATAKANEVADFLISEDPWFRPVDIQMGPDGALYVADFYNRIIGHYEVPLDHKGRDRHRGRIWRITYEGDGKNAASATPDLTKLDTQGLIASFASPNLTTRLQAISTLEERSSKLPARELRKQLEGVLENANSSTNQQIASLWAMHRTGVLDENSIRAAMGDTHREVRIHALRVAGEREILSGEAPGTVSAVRSSMIRALQDSESLVVRQAAEACGLHPHPSQLADLLKTFSDAPAEDESLRHVLKMSIRNHLKIDAIMATWGARNTRSPELDRSVAEICLGIPSAPAASFLTDLLLGEEATSMLSGNLFADSARHAASHADEKTLLRLIAAIEKGKLARDLDMYLDLFEPIEAGVLTRTKNETKKVLARLAAIIVDSAIGKKEATGDWTAVATGPNPAPVPWVLQRRNFEGKKGMHTVVSSLAPGGEELTGTLRSKPFSIPNRLSFYICGHDGFPGKPSKGVSRVRLLDATTRAELMRAGVPRNDTAQLISWDLSAHRGKSGILELVDGDNANAYAWIGVSAFTPEVVALPDLSRSNRAGRQVKIAEMAGRYDVKRAADTLEEWVRSERMSAEVRRASLHSLGSLRPAAARQAAFLILANSREDKSMKIAASGWFAAQKDEASRQILENLLSSAAAELQGGVARIMASQQPSAEWLVAAVERGKASAVLLQDKPLLEKLRAARVKDLEKRVANATSGLVPTGKALGDLIAARQVAYGQAKLSSENGAAVFTKHCAVCHQLDGKGSLIGPQLDGVAKRGLSRLMEDILDPNRNVDGAFRYSILHLSDGTTTSGLFRREDGESLVFAAPTGKEFSLLKSKVKKREVSRFSLMPPGYGEILTETQLFDLIGFLSRDKARN